MRFEKRVTTITLGLLLGLASAAQAATLFEGDLFYTTFQTQGGPAGPNVYKVHFLYDSTPAVTLSADCLVASLTGADGLIFDPNDAARKTLLAGEQNANLVASVAVGPLNVNPCPASGIVERKADGTALSGKPHGQAYGIAATPDKSHLWMMPNEPTPNPNHINVAALPLTADGVPNTVTGVDGTGAGATPTLRGVAFIGAQGYYGDASDYFANGHFGTISNSFVTARVVVVDDVAGTTTDQNGFLPTHGMTFDGYSGCIIASGSNLIWQLCPPGVAGAAADGKFHVRAKIATAPQVPGSSAPICKGPATADLCNATNWDQTSTDTAGHMFAANNNGDLLFVDYSANASRLINNNLGGTAPFMKEQYLRVDLDDIINGGGAPPPPVNADGRMTGGGSVFTAGGIRVTHGFEIHCDVADVPNRLEINWDGGNNFHLETLTSAFCFTDPKIDSGHPTAPFNTYIGAGTGKLNGVDGAAAAWTFTDAGEPGTNDKATITITDPHGKVVLTVSGFLDNGNQQAHTDNK